MSFKVKYPQSFCTSIGEYGCYMLCLIDIAEEYTGRHFDMIEVAREGIDKGYIEFHEDNYKNSNNFYVEKPDLFLKMLTGKTWSVRKVFDNNYKPKENEYVIERWARNGYAHFARTWKNFNSLQDSKCVTLGSIESLRVLTVNEKA